MRFLIYVFIMAMLAGCSGSAEKKEEKVMEQQDITKNKDYKKGLALVSQNRCLTCHQVEDKLTGPSYREIANTYADYPDTIVSHLARRIITGGNGVWGEVRMTPHPQVSKKDAEAMVRYILLLKSK